MHRRETHGAIKKRNGENRHLIPTYKQTHGEPHGKTQQQKTKMLLVWASLAYHTTINKFNVY